MITKKHCVEYREQNVKVRRNFTRNSRVQSQNQLLFKFFHVLSFTQPPTHWNRAQRFYHRERSNVNLLNNFGQCSNFAVRCIKFLLNVLDDLIKQNLEFYICHVICDTLIRQALFLSPHLFFLIMLRNSKVKRYLCHLIFRHFEKLLENWCSAAFRGWIKIGNIIYYQSYYPDRCNINFICLN